MPELAELARIHAASFTTPPPWGAAEIRSLMDSPYVFLLQEPGGFLIGRAVAGEAELLTLAVDPDLRRQGTGRALVTAFLLAAQARAADSAFLEVSAENAAAIALYDSAGFHPAGRRRGYYAAPDGRRIDALVLSRPLSARS